MSQNNHPEFGPVRTFLWPIHSDELKKFLPMFALVFCIAFCYNLLRTLKDAIIITAAQSGAEVIPFIKVWVMLPMAVIITAFFTRISQYFNRERVFYILTSVFLLFFTSFILILYPNRESLHLHSLADHLQTILPSGLSGGISMIRYWSFTLFYAMSELWGSTILFVLFWGFANQITKMHEAKRFYGLFGLGANISGWFTGTLSIWAAQTKFDFLSIYTEDGWEQTLIVLTSMVLVTGLSALALFRWINKNVLSDPRFYDTSMQLCPKKKKKKLGFFESLRYLSASQYVMYIALIVVTYNMVINLTEVPWKSQIKALYPESNDYYIYMSKITRIIAVIAALSGLLISGNSIRKFGWTFTALITPVILFITTIFFFSFLVFDTSLEALTIGLLGSTPLVMAVLFGSLQNCLSRASKYTVFDTTKEIAFLPLDEETRIHGKAAIDGVGSRLGKSGGALILQSLFLTFGSLAASLPFIGGIILALISVWIFAVKRLGKSVHAATNKKSSTS